MDRPQPSAGILADVQNPSFRSLLDLLRWTAAFMVFAGHLRGNLMPGHADIAEDADGILVQVFYVLSGFGFLKAWGGGPSNQPPKDYSFVVLPLLVPFPPLAAHFLHSLLPFANFRPFPFLRLFRLLPSVLFC